MPEEEERERGRSKLLVNEEALKRDGGGGGGARVKKTTNGGDFLGVLQVPSAITNKTQQDEDSQETIKEVCQREANM